MGFDAEHVASLLGISDRYARRLVRPGDLASPFLRAAYRWGPREARRLVAELRGQLWAEGFHFHPGRPRPVFMVKELTPEETLALGRAGLTPEQVLAITMVGMGSDEMNELLLRGVRG